jgi:hypothetical protein
MHPPVLGGDAAGDRVTLCAGRADQAPNRRLRVVL